MIRLDYLARLKTIGDKVYPLSARESCLQKRQDALNNRAMWFKTWVKVLENKPEEDQLKKIEQMEMNIKLESLLYQ